MKQIFHLHRRKSHTNQGSDSFLGLTLWFPGNALCSVAARRGKTDLSMLLDFMAVPHVLFDMYNSEVYHSP